MYTTQSLPPSIAGTVTVNCTGDTPFALTSGPEDDPPVFTLSCTSSGGPVTNFSCTSTDAGSIDGVVTFTNILTNHEQGNYDLSVSVTGYYPGVYTCQVTVYKYDDIGTEPEMMNYVSAQTITVTGELVTILLSMTPLSCCPLSLLS